MNFVSILFRLVNFGIVCAVAVYFSKKKLIPQVKEKIAAKYAQLKEMSSQSKHLLDEQEELEREIDQQEILAKNLYDQIKIWSLSFDKQQKEFEERQNFLTQRATERLQLQAERKMKKAASDSVAAKALKKAQQELVSFFASEKEGRAFIADIVEHMREDRA